MAYIFTAITGGQTVGQAFTRVNQNLAAIEDNIPTGGTSGNFLPLSGGSLTGNVIMATGTNLKVQNGFNWIIYSGNSIQFYDDNFATNINLKPSYPMGNEVNITLSDYKSGDIAVIPTPYVANRFIGTLNSSTDGYDFIQLSAGTGIAIDISAGGDIYTIRNTSSGPSGSGFSAATSVGNGLSIISSATNNTLRLFTLSGTNGLVVSTATTGLMTFRGPTTANRVFMTDASGNMVNSDFLFTDDTNDTLGIGIAAATTARLLLPVQTATITPLRFSKTSTEYTGAVDGSIWYSSSGNTLKFQKSSTTTDFIFKDNNISLTGATVGRVLIADTNGTISTGRDVVNFGVFNMLTSKTITDSTSETSILNTDATVFYGTNVLAASTAATAMLVAGKKFRFTAKGTIATDSSAGILTARMKLGSTVIASHSGFTLKNSISEPNVLNIESTFTIRTQGASGTVIGSGMMTSDDELASGGGGGGNHFFGIFNNGSLTLDTTSDKVFDFTFQFGTASANNIITINEATLEYLN